MKKIILPIITNALLLLAASTLITKAETAAEMGIKLQKEQAAAYLEEPYHVAEVLSPADPQPTSFIVNGESLPEAQFETKQAQVFDKLIANNIIVTSTADIPMVLDLINGEFSKGSLLFHDVDSMEEFLEQIKLN